MIYLKGAKHILILEPANLQQLKEGDTVFSPDHEVLLIYTPDAVWFQEQLVKIIGGDNSIDPNKFDEIHAESLNRAEVFERPYHELKNFVKKQ